MVQTSIDVIDSFFVEDKSLKPTRLDIIYYLFFTMGVTLEEFNNLPLPYIFMIINTHVHVKKEEEKALKKANRR